MDAKILEIRDRHTMFAVIAVAMVSGPPYPPNGTMSEDELKECLDRNLAKRYLLRRHAYADDDRHPAILLTHAGSNGSVPRAARTDPRTWGDRTYTAAHQYIVDHWHDLKDGDVVDVEFVLGEKSEPAVALRLDDQSGNIAKDVDPR